MSNASLPAGRPFVIVVGLDRNDTESSGYALNQAAYIAMRIAQSQLHLCNVLSPAATDETVRETAGWLQRYVSAKATELGGLAQQSVGIHVRSGEPGHEIAQLANDTSADMIIVGTHRHPQPKHLFMGSTAEHVMATATCPVLVAGPRPPAKPAPIVIEPPCPDCVLTRQTTQGRTWWCARHSEHHHLHKSHRYSYQTELPFAEHDSEVTATGV
jgi:nucleotide-binding universal stress UspA family protein